MSADAHAAIHVGSLLHDQPARDDSTYGVPRAFFALSIHPLREDHVMKQAIFGIACLAIGFAAVAMAQNAQNPATNPGSQKVAPPMQFSSLDTNKDGRVSKDEVKAHNDLTSSFATLDVNKDTYLSEAEFGKWHAPGTTPPSGNMTTPDKASTPAPGPAPQSPPAGR
jgi:hypothetical protein